MNLRLAVLVTAEPLISRPLSIVSVNCFGDVVGNQDVMEFSTAVFANFAAVQGAMQQVGRRRGDHGDATDVTRVRNVTLSALDATDFLFV